MSEITFESEEIKQVFNEEKQELNAPFSNNFQDPAKVITVVGDIPTTESDLESQMGFKTTEEKSRLGFNSQPKPWLSPALLKKLDKTKKGALKHNELSDLMEEIAEICADFYKVKLGQAIAVRFDGRIVESADTEIDLLLKIQGKKFDSPIFVWQVGSESFSGWRT